MRQPRVTRLVTRLVISHVLVILVVIGVAGAALLSQSRRYFVDADRRALLVQARVAAGSCDDICVQTHTASASVPVPNSRRRPTSPRVKSTGQPTSA